MSKKGLKLGVALAAGAGAAAILTKTSQENKEIKATKAKKAEAARSDYRNTERGKYEKNSKGIYYLIVNITLTSSILHVWILMLFQWYITLFMRFSS